MKIALTHNCEIRNNGTATYALRAMRQLGEENGWEVDHYQPRGKVPEYDWYLYVDDGRDDLDWIPPKPNAYWAIDTHLGYAYRLDKARKFDKVFVAQKQAVSDFAKDGVSAQWLPLACQPEAHPNKEELTKMGADTDERYDIAFVGFLTDQVPDGANDRVEYLDALFKAFPNSWLSTGVFFEEMALRYVRAKLGFNVSIKRDLNMRVFEVMSTGVPLLTNRNVDGIDDLFTEGEDYIGYEGADDMVGAATEFLHGRIGPPQRSMEKVRSHHTYRHRMLTIAEEMAHA